MKPDLIILHGALGTKQQFGRFIELLEPFFNIHTLDFIGHGMEPPTSSFGIGTFADQLAEFITIKELHKPVVFGYSMGGYVALFLEASRPGSLGKIFTLATKYEWNPESSKKEAGYLQIDVMKEKVPKYLDYLKKLHGDQWQNTVNQTREMMLRMGSAPELSEERLKNVQIDCLISVGEWDRMVSAQETQQLASSIPNARFEIWSEMEHPIEKVDAKIITEKLTSFLLN